MVRRNPFTSTSDAFDWGAADFRSADAPLGGRYGDAPYSEPEGYGAPVYDNSPRTICLLGPTNGGKTSLLAAAGVTRRICHGFDQVPGSLLFRSIARKAPPGEAGSEGEEPKEHNTGFEDKDYTEIRDAMWRDNVARTDHKDLPKPYKFMLEDPEGGRHQAVIDIVDSSGELFVAGSTKGWQDAERKCHEKLLDVLKVCHGIVLVLPAPGIRSSDMKRDGAGNDAYARHIALIADAIKENPNISRIVVAISKIERMFLNCGQRAFRTASERDEVGRDMTTAVRAWEGGLEQLHDLCVKRRPKVDIVYVPTSAFGYVAEFGNPNLDLSEGAFKNGDERRYGWNDANGVGNQARDLWRPFCARDPFVLATFQRARSRYTFTRSDLFGPGTPQEIIEEPEVQPHKGGRWALLLAIGNAILALIRWVRLRIDADFGT
jgi:hypothetical protein